MSISDVSTVLQEARERFAVRHAWVFGSRSTGTNHARSDWDILVEFAKPPSFEKFMGLREFLEEKLSARVDLLSRSACKPRFLKAIEKDLIHVA